MARKKVASPDAEDQEPTDTEDTVLVNLGPSDITLNYSGLSVTIPGSIIKADGSIEKEGSAIIPDDILNGLAETGYFKALFSESILREA